VALLRPEHDRSLFDCGNSSLNQYLLQHAGQDSRRRLAAVYVLLDGQESRIAGYCTLSASIIELTDLPENEVRKLPRYPWLPACLLGRLAIDRKFQGQGLGGLLLLEALELVVELSARIGILTVTVEAIDDDAVAFYQHYGFKEYGVSARQSLYLHVADAQKLFQPKS
jgi:GNAT superfamily N-acetyltransferase